MVYVLYITLFVLKVGTIFTQTIYASIPFPFIISYQCHYPP